MNASEKPRNRIETLTDERLSATASGTWEFPHVHAVDGEDSPEGRFSLEDKERSKQITQDSRTNMACRELQDGTAPGRAALLAAVVNSSHDAIIAMSMSGAIVSWNGGAQRLYGYAPAEAIGKSFSFLVPLDRLDEFLQVLNGAQHDDALPIRETVHVRKGGSQVRVLVSVSPIRNLQGAIAGISVISREVCEPSAGEQELRRRNEKLTEMVNNLQQRNSEMNLLQELSERLESCCSSNEVHPLLEKLLPKLFPTGSGTLFEWNAELKLLEAGMRWGEESSQEILFSSEECWAVRRGQPHEVVGPDSHVRCPHLARTAQANTICTPLIVSGETLGLLSVRGSPYELSQPREVQERLSSARMRTVETASRHIALTLANLKLRERLQAQSIRDPVTALFNRRYLDETLPREVHRASRDGKCFSIILCDIDHFKEFNDRYGHSAGDSLLQCFGSLVQKTVRAGDIACRYGGDEFVLMLLETPLETAKRRADLLQREFQRLTVPFGESSLGPGTLTLGVSSYPIHGVTASALLAAADRALYRGKAHGGNLAVVGETLS